MSLSRVLETLSLLLAGIGLLWMFMPTLMKRLGMFSIRMVPSEDPRATERPTDDTDYARRYGQLLALGFEPLGATREWGWFITPFNWRWQSVHPTGWFRSGDRRTLVGLYRVVPGEPVRFGAVSLLEGRGMVRTACPGAGVTTEIDPDHRRIELKNVEPADLLARHRENAEGFSRDRGRPVVEATLTRVADEDMRIDRLMLSRQRESGFGTLVAGCFALPALGFLLLVLFAPGRAGVRLHDLAFSVCAGVGIFAVLRHQILTVQIPQNARKSHGGLGNDDG